MEVRTRFAPSPTGSLHIGGARTALFNWLYARRAAGQFILRIEDTDKARNTQASLEILLAGLRWLGIQWDEGPQIDGQQFGDKGPYFQSQRSALYRRYLDELTAKGRAYEKDGVIRFKMPQKPIVIPDLIVGEVTRKLTDREAQQPDFVLVRADGQPVFHLVNAVDDLEMGITHVIRGEDHLSNTSKHLSIIRALGRTPPQYAHIPLILNADGTKMSKRDSGASIGHYMEEHYAPEAVANYLCLLGWSPKNDREKFPMEEVLRLFNLRHILRHNAKFDREKLQWLNGEYLREMESSRYARLAQSCLESKGFSLSSFGTEYIRNALATTQGKVRELSELPNYAGFYFEADDSIAFDPKEAEKHFAPANLEGMQRLRAVFGDLDSFQPEAVQSAFKDVAEKLGVKVRALVHPIRLACTGKTAGPSLYHLLSILGKERARRRIHRAILQAKQSA